MLKLSALWQSRNFVRLWLSETVSLFGSHITFLALPITAVLLLNADPAQMGILGACQYLPFLLIGPFAGVWVDRLPRLPVLIGANIGRALLLSLIPLAVLLNMLSIVQLYILGFLVGTLTLFFDVAYQSFFPSVVDRANLIEGNSKLEVSRSVAQIVGPGLGGTLVQILTAPIAILFDSISFIISALLLSSIRAQEKPSRSQESTQTVWQEMVDGGTLVIRNPVLRALALAAGTFNLFNSMTTVILILYMSDILGISPGIIGVIFTIGACGSLLGAVTVERIGHILGVGPTIIWAIVLASIGAILVPLASGSLFVIVVFLITAQFLESLAVVLYNVQEVSITQAITPDQMLGRVNAIMRMITWGTLPLGSLLGGWLAQFITIRPTLVISAVGQLIAIIWLLFSPVYALRKHSSLEKIEQWSVSPHGSD
jgi:MFS family permease